jgi:hypothetical protein
MLRRSLHLSFVLYQFIWLVIVIPVHTRGIVSMDGTPCCPYCHHSDQKHPTPQPGNCAICNFAAHLMLPPVIDCRPAALRLAEIVPIAEPSSWNGLSLPTPYHGRAPPAA